MSSSTLNHFTHPKHPLILKNDLVIGVYATCHICNKSVIGSPTYTCIVCESFYLHKTCAEFPKQINHHKHNIHPLVLLPRDDWFCDVCACEGILFAYTCDICDFDVCVFCAFEQRVLHHPGHSEHSLTLIKREALFKCDACGEEARDSSYSCNPCEFWIHKTCALLPFIIPDPTYHHHPLNLIYSIPEMHRYFYRLCVICKKLIQNYYWLYYCHKCTYLVHVKCAKPPDTVSTLNQIEADDIGNYPDLVVFPLPSEESLFELIITQCSKLQDDFPGEPDVSTIHDDPYIIKEHRTHKNHPLEQLQFTTSVNDDDSRVLICDGCIQPITVSCPSYYACMQCQFFLHSFCATKLPTELPIGACRFHPQHSLVLKQKYMFYDFWKCGVCGYSANGFYYKCEICDIRIEIRCAFLPTRIRHKSHKHHSLVQRPSSGSRCSASNLEFSHGVEYACETCTTFQIHITCAFYPSRMNHKYDDHPLTLRYPPFFHEGVIYCEICEDQVNNQILLYHCGQCDHPFHHDCIRSHLNVKLGGKIEHNIGNQLHTLALVIKKYTTRNCRLYSCGICERGYDFQFFCECDGCGFQFFFQCDGCGFLACTLCIRIKPGNLPLPVARPHLRFKILKRIGY